MTALLFTPGIFVIAERLQPIIHKGAISCAVIYLEATDHTTTQELKDYRPLLKKLLSIECPSSETLGSVEN